MRLGIDFGTTHTVAALVDRGNYPVVPLGELDVAPSIVAAHDDGRLLYGHAAAAVARTPGFSVLRSAKRLLHGAGPLTEVALGPSTFLLAELLAGFLSHVREEILAHAPRASGAEKLEAAISVPANASSGQRMLTLDAFRAAGFDVVRLLNEPSAAACEYAHRHARTVSGKREHVLVYDLGGGTFDASVLRLGAEGSEVVGSAGLNELGGDDFDQVIYQLALERAGLDENAVPPPVRAALLEECRLQKESVNPSTRKLVIDLSAALVGGGLSKPGGGAVPDSVTLPADAVYAACAPLVEASLVAMDEALRDAHDGDGVDAEGLAGIYVVGGQSAFPPVYRTLRERFGQHRVHRSPHPYGSCAIGLAIHLAEGDTRKITEKLTRHFGVFREAQGGREVSCDVLLAKDTRLPAPGAPPLEVRRRYRPAHNIGHFRFFECARIDDGRPEGNLSLWDDLRFPFDKRLRDHGDLSDVTVERSAAGAELPEVEETVRAFPSGEIEVELRTLDDGYLRKATIAPRGTGLSRPPPGSGAKRSLGPR